MRSLNIIHIEAKVYKDISVRDDTKTIESYN